MTTEPLFRDAPRLDRASATVLAAGREGVLLDRTVFYPTGGGQPGDSGVLRWPGGEAAVAEAVKGETPGAILHRLAEGAQPPPVGGTVEAVIDWDRRWGHMRMHTALHLLCAVVPGDVTGGQIAADKARLDFAVPSASLDRMAIEAAVNALIAASHPVATEWITDEALAARPDLVRTMSVRPPSGTGRVRLVRIGTDASPVDLQPCGGTHVADTGEIGRILVTKIENKGRQNRRVVIGFA